MKRILLVLTVALVMAAMLAAMAMPAFAKAANYGQCQGGQGSNENRVENPSHNNFDSY
jgi:Tfp pilus assembly protein FimT